MTSVRRAFVRRTPSGRSGGHHRRTWEKDHEYASTLKTSAILVASLVGLWLGIIGQVSASTESVQVVTARPSAEDCGGNSQYTNIVVKWSKILLRYSGGMGGASSKFKDVNYTLDAFKADMNDLLTSRELINCSSYYGDSYDGDGYTGPWIAYRAAHYGSVEGAKWAVSKGADLTIRYRGQFTAYDLALFIAANTQILSKYNRAAAEYLEVAQILKPPPSPATKSCAEVDGQTPPANEYCIVAENVQSSIKTEVSQSLKRLIGVDYRYNTDKSLSGTALYPGYKATITFTCASGIQDCGPAYVPGDRWSDNFLNLVKKTFGLSVKCGDSGNLLDVDSIEPGESVSVTHSSDTERSSPWYRNCEAISGGPFTLSIKTTRLAQ